MTALDSADIFPPNPSVRKGEWLSVYLPIRGGIYETACDEAIRRVVRPIIDRSVAENVAVGAFFVRYVENWPQIRLRLRARSAECRPPLVHIVETEWHRRGPAWSKSPADVRWVSYEPELGRYGGAYALPLAEDFFKASSEFALSELTEQLSKERPLRLGRAVLAMLALLHAFLGNAQAVKEFVGQYSDGYLKVVASNPEDRASANDFLRNCRQRSALTVLPFVEAAWVALESGASLTPALDAYALAARTARSALERLTELGQVELHGRISRDWKVAGPFFASSLVHMTSNRLGITIFEESYVASVLQAFFEANIGQ